MSNQNPIDILNAIYDIHTSSKYYRRDEHYGFSSQIGPITNYDVEQVLELAIKTLKHDRDQYQKGFADALGKIRAEIVEYGSIKVSYAITNDTKTDEGLEKLLSDVLKQTKEQVLDIIDNCKAESEPQESEEIEK